METERVTLVIEDQIALVCLNRPEKHNALDMPMFYAIRSTIKKLNRNKSIRVVIVKGNGENFCSGLDIKAVMNKPLNGFKLLWKWWPFNANLAQIVTIGWRRLKVPVIMVMHGKCWGGGMQIALGGDFRIASADVSLSVMEAKWGLIPDMGGTLGLSENLPIDQAMKLAMTAETINSKQALEKNLITQVAEDPITVAKELAQLLKERSPDTNRLIKKMYYKTWGGKQGSVLAAETFNQWKIFLGKNRNIAVKKALGNKDVNYV